MMPDNYLVQSINLGLEPFVRTHVRRYCSVQHRNPVIAQEFATLFDFMGINYCVPDVIGFCSKAWETVTPTASIPRLEAVIMPSYNLKLSK